MGFIVWGWIDGGEGMTKLKHKLRAKLTRGDIPNLNGCEIRNINTEDGEALAELMLNAYKGTVDYEGEDIEDARDEVRRLSEGEYGEPLWDCSFVAEMSKNMVGAVVVTLDRKENVPLLAFAMTSPDKKRLKVATTLMKKTVNSMIDAGFKETIAYVTEGNEPSAGLASKFGFKIEDV